VRVGATLYQLGAHPVIHDGAPRCRDDPGHLVFGRLAGASRGDASGRSLAHATVGGAPAGGDTVPPTHVGCGRRRLGWGRGRRRGRRGGAVEPAAIAPAAIAIAPATLAAFAPATTAPAAIAPAATAPAAPAPAATAPAATAPAAPAATAPAVTAPAAGGAGAARGAVGLRGVVGPRAPLPGVVVHRVGGQPLGGPERNLRLRAERAGGLVLLAGV
jgi:hypothetical protein